MAFDDPSMDDDLRRVRAPMRSCWAKSLGRMSLETGGEPATPPTNLTVAFGDRTGQGAAAWPAKGPQKT